MVDFAEAHTMANDPALDKPSGTPISSPEAVSWWLADCYAILRNPNSGRLVMVTEAQVRKALRTVKDPEMNLDLVVLGLIYGIEIEGSHVEVTMSLTSPACPVAGEILEQARTAVEGIEGVERADVELTFSPPWTPERIPPTVRSALGL